jgi:hypothetical protein
LAFWRGRDEEHAKITLVAAGRRAGACHSDLPSTDVSAQPAKGAATPVVRRASPLDEKEKMNAWSVGLAGGLLEGAPLRLAADGPRRR